MPTRTQHTQARGFSLIELMIAVVIVAILMAVALPTYQSQLRRTNRSAAQAHMLEIASVQQQFLLSNRAYMDSGMLAAAGYTPDSAVSRHYRQDLSLGAGVVPTFELRLTPLGSQAADGWLQLDSQGTLSSQYANRWQR